MARRKKTSPRPKNPVLMQNELIEFGTAVRTHREGLGLSRIALAEQAGVKFQNIGNIECGRNWPSVPVLLAIRKTLTGSIGTLL